MIPDDHKLAASTRWSSHGQASPDRQPGFLGHLMRLNSGAVQMDMLAFSFIIWAGSYFIS
jgi:hypothetical protein